MLKKGWSIFWSAYMLFFAVPFPMILYYTINYTGGDRSPSTLSGPYWALTCLAVSVIVWCVVLVGALRRWILRPLKQAKRLNRLQYEGTRKDAKVIELKPTGKTVQGFPELEVTLQVDNLAGTAIRETLVVVDSRPGLGRFDVGKSVRVRMSQDSVEVPALVLDGAETKSKTGYLSLMLLVWLLLVAAVIGYYLFSYRYESRGTGWRFLGFFHPLIICPLALGGISLLFGRITRLFSGRPDHALELKYKGLRADARIISVSQTGTYINNQPQVKFDLEYNDRKGQTHRVSLKKIVSLMEIGSVNTGTVSIVYLENKPNQIAFAKDLE